MFKFSETNNMWSVKPVRFLGLAEVDYKRVTHRESGYWGYATEELGVADMKAKILAELDRVST